MAKVVRLVSFKLDERRPLRGLLDQLLQYIAPLLRASCDPSVALQTSVIDCKIVYWSRVSNTNTIERSSKHLQRIALRFTSLGADIRIITVRRVSTVLNKTPNPAVED